MMETVTDFDPVLLNTFIVNDKRCRVYFHRNALIWENESSPSQRNIVPVNDVISVDFLHGKTCNCSESRTNGAATQLETFYSPVDISEKHNAFVVNYAFDTNANNKWKVKKIIFHHSDPLQISSWFITLNNALNNQNSRPKNILVFVNPYCGKRKGIKLYSKYVEPVLNVAHVKITKIVTEYQNHARDFIFNTDLDNYDAILLVGGDGTVSEVFNALIFKTLRLNNYDENDVNVEIPEIKMPVSIIPGGSTDCIAYCLNGNADRETAAIFTVLGDKVGLDVSSVHNNQKLLRFYLSMMCYGFLGDVLKESDKFRWMGPQRYEYAGFKKIFANKGYHCDVDITYTKQKYDKFICKQSCGHCVDKENGSKQRYQEDYLKVIKDKLNEKVTNTEEIFHKNIKGKFLAVACANMSCACDRSPNGFSPYSHIGDGFVDIILIKHGSMFRTIKFLLSVSSKKLSRTVMDLPFVEVYRVREIHVKPVDSTVKNSVWNCDGEVLTQSNILIKSHKQLVTVFSRRPSMDLVEVKYRSCLFCGLCSN